MCSAPRRRMPRPAPSYGWKMGLQARLYDGQKSLDQFRALLTRSSLPNLFSLCNKALQIDANLGAASAIAEMLVQSHQEAMHLLPALPAEWSSGSVHGLRARGLSTVTLDGRAVKLELRTPDTVAFDVAAGGVYELR